MMKMIIPALFLSGAVIGGIGYMVLEQTGHVVHPQISSTSGSAGETFTAGQLSAMSPDALIEMQKDALAALGAHHESAEIAEISGRPEFVSPTEWLILNSVAGRNEHPERELLRLVNLLRFNKRMELWQQADTVSERARLAEIVLDLIPARVANSEMSKEKAQSIQYRVLSSVTQDSSELRRRAGQEAQRIGVQFGFDETSS